MKKPLINRVLLSFFGVLVLFFACKSPEQPVLASVQTEVAPANIPWVDSAVIYEVNIRQYTPEGTFNAFAAHLPRLKSLGVDVLWLMPVFPISETKRKGSLGSYYAVSDFRAINPHYGDLEDFRSLVQKIHAQGMKVVLDWVPNHTGFDHTWTETHPDWYNRDPKTDTIIHPAGTDWTDVADLNYDSPGMREAMVADMKYWVQELDIDGFRCDVAGEVPVDFWVDCVQQLQQIKSLFMLAEAEAPELRNNGAFLVDYGWEFHHLMNEIGAGKAGAPALDAWLAEDRRNFQRGFHMVFVTNHDENSWNGTVQERLGDAADALTMLTFTFDGMPLIYSGQEQGLNKRLRFFEKDTIPWNNPDREDFFRRLVQLKHRNPALWNGHAGGAPVKLSTDQDKTVYAFTREKSGNRVVVVVNFSAQPSDFQLKADAVEGLYENIFGNSTLTLAQQTSLQLGPWEYMVLVRKPGEG